jgi:hypothetical protein
MSDAELSLSPELTLLLMFPFNLGFGVEPLPTEERRPLLAALAAGLGGAYPRYSWSLRPFPELPGTLLDKGAYVVGELAGASVSTAQVAAAFPAADSPAVLAGEIREEVVYFDHGIGSVNLAIPLRITSPQALPELPQLALRIIDNLRTSQSGLGLRADWTRFRQAVREVLSGAGALLDVWGILARGGEGRSFVSCVSQNFILHTTAAGAGLPLQLSELPQLLAPMTGLAAADNANLLPSTAGVVFLAEGWDGQVAVLSEPGRLPWVQHFWQLATDYWAALSDLDAFLYEQTRALGRSRPHSHAEAHRTMAAIRRIENSVAVLAHESVPENIWDSTEQIRLHKGIYDSWETAPLMQGVKEKLEYLGTHYQNLNQMLSSIVQERMDVTMMIFTFMTFAGVLADCIASVDFQGSGLSTKLRLAVICIGTVSCVAFSTVMGLLVRGRAASRM